MQRPYNDRWERTRRYLLRNLLDYQGELSPIPEEARSDSSDDRPCSPLPELIVEPEPNRHDHNEAFYDGLTVRMRQYYRRLFIDGASVHEAGLYDANNISSSSEFEVNRSMASTFVIDTNNCEEEKRHTLTADDETCIQYDSITNADKPKELSTNMVTQSTCMSLEERNKANYAMDVTYDKPLDSDIQGPSRSDVTNEDESEVSTNKTQDPQVSEKAASKSTESDIAQSCHRTSTTVAQVHQEPRMKAPRVFEDGSPVLMPKAQELCRSVFGNVSRNILSAVNNNSEDDSEGNDGAEQEIEEQEQAHDIDLEVEWLMKSTHSISNVNPESIEYCEEEETSECTEPNQTSDSASADLVAFDYNNESPLRTSESDGAIQVQSEGSIGPNEFDQIEPTRKASHSEIHEDEILEPNNSFEMELRKGLFLSKNARKTSVTSSDENLEGESNDNEEFESVETMRGTMQTRLTETFIRESTMSKDSPLAVTFATQATAEEIEEDGPEHDDNRNDVSDVVMTETREEDEDKPLGTELTTSQENFVTDEPSNHVAAENLAFSDDVEYFNSAIDASVDGDHETSKDADAITPSVTKIKSTAEVCDDIWSVSPVQINFEELPPEDHDVPSPKYEKKKKRVSDSAICVNAHINKKRKYNNVAIQTGAPKESADNWDTLKNNFFVGRPLIYKLCNCNDHECP